MMVTKIGTYTVHDAFGTPIEFVPLRPDDGAGTPMSAPLGSGIFDIVIRRSSDPVDTEHIEEPGYGRPRSSMPLIEDEPDGDLRIRFAVVVPENAEDFTGSLWLEATQDGAPRELSLPIRTRAGEEDDTLFIFFVPSGEKLVPVEHLWTTLRIVRWSPEPDAAIGPRGERGVDVAVQLLRSEPGGFRHFNRRFSVTTDIRGRLAYGGDRYVLGLPREWPLIMRADKAGFLLRGHMVRLSESGRTNDDPLRAPDLDDIVLMSRSDIDLSGKRVLLDPGHGVVYALTSQRRSQEWYVVHQVCMRMAEILIDEFGMSPDDIAWTRSAGIGLIDPEEVNRSAAPEEGNERYELRLSPGPMIRIRDNALGLQDVSDLVLTRHADDGTPLPVSEDDRNRLVRLNETTLRGLTNERLGSSSGMQVANDRDAIRWDESAGYYVARVLDTNKTPPTVDDEARRVTIGPSDWFVIDEHMLVVLAERSALWSINKEVSGGSTVGKPPESFEVAAQRTMRETGAMGYMRAAILADAARHPSTLSEQDTRAWSITPRRDFMNVSTCDLYLSVHANWGNGIGGMCLHGKTPPDDQVRLAKFFVKYLDPFDRGLRKGGIVLTDVDKDEPGLLSSRNRRRATYVFFELEYQDGEVELEGGTYIWRIEQMMQEPFVRRVAQQIVEGVVERLLAPQDLGDVWLFDDLPDVPW